MRAGSERPRLRDTAVAPWPERVIGVSDVEKTGDTIGADRSAVDQAYESDAALGDRFRRDVVPLMGQLYGRAVRLTRDRQDAEDLVQETMLRAYVGFRSFHAGTNLAAWLYRILRNTWINAYRKQQRQPVEVAIDNLTDRQSTRYAATAPMGLRSAEVEALEALPDLEIRAALLSLPEQIRIAVYYADVEDRSYAEIAEMMGTPQGTVTSRLHRGRRQLRELLSCAQPNDHNRARRCQSWAQPHAAHPLRLAAARSRDGQHRSPALPH
jgi:RNA polymerase sigma-70 factor, ECF subfamily